MTAIEKPHSLHCFCSHCGARVEHDAGTAHVSFRWGLAADSVACVEVKGDETHVDWFTDGVRRLKPSGRAQDCFAVLEVA